MKGSKEIIGATVFLLLSLGIWILIPFQIEVISSSKINARFVPRVITIVLIFCCTVNLIQAFFNYRKINATEEKIISSKSHIRVLLMFVEFVIYGFLLELVGYEISTILVGCGILAIIGIKKWQYYVISTSFALLIGYLFRTFFYVQLP